MNYHHEFSQVFTHLILQTINPCPEPFVHNSTLNLCYLSELVAEGETRAGVRNACKARHPKAHLIALETMDELNFMTDYVFSDGSCAISITGGFTSVPGSTDWSWELSGSDTKPVTFFPWNDGEPSASFDEFYLYVGENGNFYDHFDGIPFFHNQNIEVCSVCEYDP